jgi:putative copper resistance protein D
VTESALGFVARLGTFVGVLLTLGAVVFRMYVLQRARVGVQTRRNAAKRAANIALIAVAVLLPLSVVKLQVQTAAMRFPGDPWVGVAKTMVLQTDWGKTWLAQFACLLLLIPALALARRATVLAWIPATILAVVLAVTPSTSSHAMSAEKLAAITVYVDIAHVFAASAWIGTLFVMYRSVTSSDAIGEDSANYLAALLKVFSPLALVCGALIVVSGLTSAFAHINTPNELITTQYGKTLIAKVASVSIVALFGFRNFKYLTPALARSGSAPMRRGMLYELIATLVVLIVTAVLVVTPPPVEAMGGMNMSALPAPKAAAHASPSGSSMGLTAVY